MTTDETATIGAEAKGQGHAMIGDRYRVLVDTPVRELDRPGAAAYVARDLRTPDRSLIAFISAPHLQPRVAAMVQTKTMRGSAIFAPLDWGPVPDPKTKVASLASVFDRPDRGPLMTSMNDRIEPISADQLRKRLLAPAVETLMLLNRRGLAHRAIRPTNLYRGSDEQGPILLGECVTTPPGWAQPACVEAIEMAMTPPNARGNGGIEHDMYALGATALFLAIGRCPVARMDETELVRSKIEQGSFLALLNGDRSPLGMREPLRGLLADDPLDRWTVQDLDEWLTGNLRRPIRVSRIVRTDRPFSFKGRDYRHPTLLAAALGGNWKDAIPAVKSPVFRNWIGVGVQIARNDQPTASEPEATEDSGTEPQGNDVSRICMELDPLGPLRFRGLTLMADGMGDLLGEALAKADKELTEILADAIVQGVCAEWLDRPVIHRRNDSPALLRKFQALQKMLRHGGPAQGIERCLYEISRFAPCLSKAVAPAYVYSLRDLLPALEATVARRGRLPELVDRHLAAFIAARIKASVERPLMLVGDNDTDSIEAKLGMVGMLAAVQADHGPETVPALTTWLADELEPAVAQFQSRTLRSDIRRRLESVASLGRLGQLHDHLNNPDLLKRDQMSRQRAAREFAEAAAKIEELQSSAYQQTARQSGWRAATGASSAIATAAILAMILW